MNRWLFLVFGLVAFSPIHDKHETFPKIDDEIKAIESQTQDIQFTVFPGTPTIADVQDRQIVIIGSGTWSALMYRFNNEIWAVRASCVTVIK